MNGCQYAQKRFSAPASWHTDQARWDYAFLPKTEMMRKYKISERAYEEFSQANGLVNLSDLK